MPTKYAELFSALAEPIEKRWVKTRQQAGRNLSYITARTVMNRLDEVVGPADWWDEYVPGQNSVVCKLTVRLPDGSTVTKCDAGGHAGMSDQGDDEKSGYSDAFKRAAVKFGIGRELYGDSTARFDGEPARAEEPANGYGPGRHGEVEDTRPRHAPNSHPGERSARVPTTGRALFAWIKQQEILGWKGLLGWVNDWAKQNDVEGRIVDWSDETVELAYEAACDQYAEASNHSPAPASAPRNGASYSTNEVPATGKALKDFIRKAEERVRGVILPQVQKFGASKGFPVDMWNWSGQAVVDGYEFACEEVQKREDNVSNGQANHIPAPGLLDVKDGDPLRELKLQFKCNLVAAYKAKRGGASAKANDLIAFVNDRLAQEVATDEEPPTFSNLRDCRDEMLLQWISDEMGAMVQKARMA